MKLRETLKMVLVTISLIVIALLGVCFALNAWDYTMSDEELVYYHNLYPNEEKLNKMIQQRGINVDDFVIEEN
jgi:hypothetical protein